MILNIFNNKVFFFKRDLKNRKIKELSAAVANKLLHKMDFLSLRQSFYTRRSPGLAIKRQELKMRMVDFSYPAKERPKNRRHRKPFASKGGACRYKTITICWHFVDGEEKQKGYADPKITQPFVFS